jgi:hypothetical protein
MPIACEHCNDFGDVAGRDALIGMQIYVPLHRERRLEGPLWRESDAAAILSETCDCTESSVYAGKAVTVEFTPT